MTPVKGEIKAKKGKKPPKHFHETVSVANGLKKAPSAKAEVSGRGAWTAWYFCWNCGAHNLVPGGVYAFNCWHCGAFNTAP